jgi:hypothetical protein
MNRQYLFRFDNAKENNLFMEDARARGLIVYAGRELKIGRGWIPDYLMVASDEAGRRFTLTIIELDATDTLARVSSRKYLPESSNDIVKAFYDYLDGTIAECRRTADPRCEAFEDLRKVLERATKIAVESGCALRSRPTLIEKLQLFDQALEVEPPPQREIRSVHLAVPLMGRPVLTRQQTRALYRAVLILDAVIRKRDHGAAKLKAWLGGRTQPLKKLILEQESDCPELRGFLKANKNTGIRLSMEKLLEELARLWSAATSTEIPPSAVRSLIHDYLPVAAQLSMHERVQRVFEGARSLVKDKWIYD